MGREELRTAYDGVHEHYDDFWLTHAAPPIHDLVGKIPWKGGERVFEAGCGTGYATALLAWLISPAPAFQIPAIPHMIPPLKTRFSYTTDSAAAPSVAVNRHFFFMA